MRLRIKQILHNKHLLSLAGNAVMAVMGVATYAILYRLLPESAMGNWIFFQFAFVLLDSFRTGFLQTALVKFYAGADAARRREVGGTCWYLGMLITLACGAPALIQLFAAFTTADVGVRMLVQWYAPALVLTLPFNVAFWMQQAEERFDRILWLRLVNQGSFILMLVVLYALGNLHLATVLAAFLLASTLTSTVALASGWARFGYLAHRTRACLGELFHFGKYSVGTYLFSNLLKSSDTFIIKFMLGPAALAVYNLPQRLMEIVEVPMRSFVATAMPVLSAAHNSGDKQAVVKIIARYTARLTLLFIPIVVGVLLLADWAVLILGGGKYAGTEAANVFRIFMLFAVLFPFDRFSGITLDIIHKPHLNLVKVGLCLGINVVTDLVGIGLTHNVYGAAAASIFTLLFAVAYGYYALRRYLPLTMPVLFAQGKADLRMARQRLQFKKRKYHEDSPFDPGTYSTAPAGALGKKPAA